MTSDSDASNPHLHAPAETAEGDDGVFTFHIEPDYAGGRLDKWLSEVIESLTRTRLKALIEGGALTRDGAVLTILRGK